MAGMFEVFLDSELLFRFRLKAPDGMVLAVSGAFADKTALAAGIAAVRECAGTGLVTDLSGSTDQQVTVPAPAAAQPACEERTAANRLRAFPHGKAPRRQVSASRWTGAA